MNHFSKNGSHMQSKFRYRKVQVSSWCFRKIRFQEKPSFLVSHLEVAPFFSFGVSLFCTGFYHLYFGLSILCLLYSHAIIVIFKNLWKPSSLHQLLFAGVITEANKILILEYRLATRSDLNLIYLLACTFI